MKEAQWSGGSLAQVPHHLCLDMIGYCSSFRCLVAANTLWRALVEVTVTRIWELFLCGRFHFAWIPGNPNDIICENLRLPLVLPDCACDKVRMFWRTLRSCYGRPTSRRDLLRMCMQESDITRGYTMNEIRPIETNQLSWNLGLVCAGDMGCDKLGCSVGEVLNEDRRMHGAGVRPLYSVSPLCTFIPNQWN